jgi:glutamyl-tRNA reductase
VDLSSATYAYPHLDGADRACVARRLGQTEVEPGVFVLSTCLRVEVVGPVDASRMAEIVASMMGDADFGPQLRTGAEAVEHVFRVASGLESPVVGEVEVLTQFRQAVADLKASGSVDGAFLKILETAIATGRSAREILGISPHDTMAAVAAQIVGAAPEVAVIGSGTMASAVLSALAGLPAPLRVTVVARSPEKLAGDDHISLPLDRLDEVLQSFPAVVSATAASTRLMEEDRMSEVLASRSEPLTMVDMAMPPDFSPPAGGLVRYLGIDDLARLAQGRGQTDAVTDHVSSAAAEAHHHYANQDKAVPVIRSIMASAEAAVEETYSRFAGRLSDPADREVLRQAVHTVARKLVDRPVTAVRGSRDARLVEVISTVFDDE